LGNAGMKFSFPFTGSIRICQLAMDNKWGMIKKEVSKGNNSVVRMDWVQRAINFCW
jgi:hypothetical protein